MNTHNILALADLIESLPGSSFNMAYLTQCGTPSCIAGWAAWEQMGRPVEMERAANTFSNCPIIAAAHKYLGTDLELMAYVNAELFRGDYAGLQNQKLTAEQAVRTLRHFAETGCVDWEI